MNANSYEVGTDNFAALVIERSEEIPVLVDFWAPWCAPCRALTPVLEKLTQQYGGKIALAKVNTDEHQQLAARFGVRGIPNVKAFRDGRMVDEFTGALPEAAVRQFIEGLIPSPAEQLRRAAVQRLLEGDAAGALAQLDQAAALTPNDDEIVITRAQALLLLERYDEVHAALSGLSVLGAEDDRAKRILAELDISAGAAAVDDAHSLQRRVMADPKDFEARLALADWHAGRREFEPALDLLLEVVQRDRNFGDDAARKKMVAMFGLLGNSGELVDRYRRRLAAALN